MIEGRILGCTMVAEKWAKLGGKSHLNKVPYFVSFLINVSKFYAYLMSKYKKAN